MENYESFEAKREQPEELIDGLATGPQADGPPQPMEPQPLEPQPNSLGATLAMGALTVTAVGGLTLFLLGQSTGRCAGATRSAKAQWETRQQQIEEAVRAAETAPPPAEDHE